MKFSSDFPGGNGHLLSARESENQIELSFLAESKAKEPRPLWFYFRLTELGGKSVRIRFANSTQCLGNPDGWAMNQPVYRILSPVPGAWKRLTLRQNQFEENRHLSTWFMLPERCEAAELAFCYPYTGKDLDALCTDCPDYEKTVIGYSNLYHPILRLSGSFGDESRTKKGVYITARQHSGEVTGSWVMDGMMRWLASPEGRSASRDIVWWFVPFADIDGVENGYYGKDQIWGDFNRSWSDWFQGRCEVVAVKEDIDIWSRYTDAKLVLDLHSPSHQEFDSYFVLYADTPVSQLEKIRCLHENMNRQLASVGMLPVGLRESPPDSNTSSKTGRSLEEQINRQKIPSATFECNYQGQPDGRVHTIASYRLTGEQLAKAIIKTIVSPSEQ